ncbi:MAG TPA: class II fructose-bisphosphate aldolase [Chthoniobacterales bacterium]|nr:class II fructose-bisphosphate aldolase [Chthoniobacterales bacterium]
MSVVSLKEILDLAFAKRYGVGAFNIVDDLTMMAVLDAAVETRSPVIIQVSVKTVKFWGARLLQQTFTELASQRPIPATLHLDHCPDVAVIKTCLEAGWNSALFDASNLTYAENLRQTKEVVRFAQKLGAGVEGELEAVKGVEDGVGGDLEGELVPIDKCVEFIEATGIDCFAPAIGTAHGMYATEPVINFDRVKEITARKPVPIVLHGGTGLSEDTFRRLIQNGCAKVNISTKLKMEFADGFRTYLESKPKEYDPLKLLRAVHQDVKSMATGFMNIFGSTGQAG